mmetsp:Transcript_55525/g.119477  ORF Transcript_55525/g.119477 Transcript_55525/m.119477 type:complete len:746 (-) Transcript_55525:284-2521(-)
MFSQDGAIHVIEGPEPTDAPAVDGGFDVDPTVLQSKFKKFVREFSHVTPGRGSAHMSSFKYRDTFMLNCQAKFFFLEVNINDLNTFEDTDVLAHHLRNSPTELVPLCEKALQDLYRELVQPDDEDHAAPVIQLQIVCDVGMEDDRFTMKPTMIRDLNSSQVEKLVPVQGIVVSVRKSKHKARKLTLRCTNCENTKTIFVNAGLSSAHIPSQCDGNTGVDRCPPNPFEAVDDLCDYQDDQMIRLQELPEHVPVGEMPRSVDLSVHQYLVDECKPGTRLTATGIYCATEYASGGAMNSGNRGKGTNTVKYSYLQVLGMQYAQGAGSLSITQEDEEKFEAMAKDPNIRDNIYKSVAPSICSSSKDVVEDVKKAVACLLFGGSRKHLPDGTRMRGDINVLLLGDPGTAKSQFLKFTQKASPIAVLTSGKGASAAGLTAAVVQDGSGGFNLEGGAMVLADNGVVCIDEFDKMDVKDRVAIHEAMEQQTISIAKAGITTMLNTRCSVLAAANPRFGTYDDLQNTADQMDFETTILSRFDMIFLVRDVRDEERDYNLAKHMANLHKGEIQEEKEGPLSVQELRKYLSYCKSRCNPRLTPEAEEMLKNDYIAIRRKMKEEKSSIPITVRQLEAIIRISESIAKMELRDDVDVSHVQEALRLFHVSTLDSANKERGGEGSDALLSDAEREEIYKAEEQLKKLVPRGGRKNKFQLEAQLVSVGGIEESVARRVIYSMVRRGELQERSNGTIVRTG